MPLPRGVRLGQPAASLKKNPTILIVGVCQELTMTKGGKAIKYMVKNAKARKKLKKSEKNAKKRDVCACVGVRVADNKISGSEQ